MWEENFCTLIEELTVYLHEKIEEHHIKPQAGQQASWQIVYRFMVYLMIQSARQ
jgi:hypothetical protein